MAEQTWRLVDRMRHPPLGDRDRIACAHQRLRATAAWLALVALLGNLLSPGALSTIVDLIEVRNNTPRLLLCDGWRGNAPDKTKPGLLVKHCPLCTMPAAQLPRAPAFSVPGEVADSGLMPPRPAVAVVPIRHGGKQPRAPPSAV